MEILKDKECLEYAGGAKFGIGLTAFFTAFASFVLGMIDGISNPKRCNAR